MSRIRKHFDIQNTDICNNYIAYIIQGFFLITVKSVFKFDSLIIPK